MTIALVDGISGSLDCPVTFASGAGRGLPIREHMLDQHSPSELALAAQLESGLPDSHITISGPNKPLAKSGWQTTR